MSRGLPSMTALLAMLAVAGYQNRDKISEMLGGANRQPGPPGEGGRFGGSTGGSSGGLGGLLGGATGGMGGATGGMGGAGGGLGGLGGLLGGATAGGMLGGGLKELIDRFRQNGHAETADSWVQNGPNREVQPQHLETALGNDTIDDIARTTGLSREEILTRLSRELPNAVDKYTPNGRLPDIG